MAAGGVRLPRLSPKRPTPYVNGEVPTMAVVVKNLLMFSVMILMLGVGLRTAFGEVLDVAKRYQLVMRGVLANFLMVPVVFYLALNWGPFRPDVVIGLLIMAAVPIAPMVPPFAGAAKGDVPYAVGLMTIAALLCVPLTPLILKLSLPKSEAGLEIDVLQIIQTLLTVQLIPIGLGMAINHFSRTWTEKLLVVVSKVGQIGLVISIVLIIALQGKLIIELGVLANFAVVLAIIIALLIGDLMMRGETASLRRSLALATAIRNVALGLLIVNNNYPGTPAVAVVLVFGILSMVIAVVYGKLTVRSEIVTVT
jgi:BASS family bile acid:Na+ symporter